MLLKVPMLNLGLGVANPIGSILSAAMMLEYSCNMQKEAAAVELAVRKSLDSRGNGGVALRTR